MTQRLPYANTSPTFRPPTDQLGTEATRLRTTLDSLSAGFDGTESMDLAMGWEDLRNDLESVSRDLDRPRSPKMSTVSRKESRDSARNSSRKVGQSRMPTDGTS